jgi:hypothetical protein
VGCLRTVCRVANASWSGTRLQGRRGEGRVTRGRCYEHNFLRFSTIFGKKLAFFSKTNVMIKILHDLALFWVKNANIYAKFFGENIFKIITSVPDWARIFAYWLTLYFG